MANATGGGGYNLHFRKLSARYVQARKEHIDATSIATKELKPEKEIVKKQKIDVDKVFMDRNWSCVLDPISGKYVVRTRSPAAKPLTKELMAEILAEVRSFQRAKSKSWKTVKQAATETLDVIHAMRLSDNFTVSVKPKPPTAKTPVVDMAKEGLGDYVDWLHAFVANSEALASKTKLITAKKKDIEKKFKAVEGELEDIYRRNTYVSIPIRFRRKVSPEFHSVVTATHSKHLSRRLPQKVRLYLEYVPVKKRDTVVKKFSPGKKALTACFMDMVERVKHVQDLDMEKIVAKMFEDMQAEARKANEEKLKQAETNPTFKFKVSEKKTTGANAVGSSSSSNKSTKRSYASSSGNHIQQQQPMYKRRV